MDILTHMVSGVAVGTVLASFSRRGFMAKTSILSVSAIGGILPDFDVFSLWSGFDKTFGSTFNLQDGNKIYYAQYWYSHHGFFHSFFAAFLITLILGSLLFLFKNGRGKHPKENFIIHLKRSSLILLAFCAGYIIHLLEDMPTPGYTWEGINLFWPSSDYSGGTGEIWWWNNYDLFLIIAGVAAVNLTILLLPKIKARKLTPLIFVTGLIFCIVQIKSRPQNFDYTSFKKEYNNFELQSKEIQKQILGKRLYSWMDYFDKKVPFNF
ncbi:metal-dependent hydrolase [Saccharicrinis sp. FJH2]|uniref:metal-dependent hydrolase n=1 Tax=Saccharicrinis sp. FJH65 TaxID=3344659 RepID=UPI0035F28D27